MITISLYVLTIKWNLFRQKLRKFDSLKRSLTNFNQLLLRSSNLKLTYPMVFYTRRIIVAAAIICL